MTIKVNHDRAMQRTLDLVLLSCARHASRPSTAREHLSMLNPDITSPAWSGVPR